MARDAYEGLGARIWHLMPVWAVYAVLLGFAALGRILPTEGMLHTYWFIFFLAPFSSLYSIPFGMGMGILAQVLVWYTPEFGHRLVVCGSALVAVAMGMCWWPALTHYFDVIYLAAWVWPVVSSALAMLVGMHFVREREYELAVAGDDYGYDEQDFDYEGDYDN